MAGKLIAVGLVGFFAFTVLVLVGLNEGSWRNEPDGTQRVAPGMPRPIAASALPEPESEGARLHRQHCAGCHGIPDPSEHPAEAWPAILERMHPRMGLMGQPRPSREAWQTLETYLQTHARPAGG